MLRSRRVEMFFLPAVPSTRLLHGFAICFRRRLCSLHCTFFFLRSIVPCTVRSFSLLDDCSYYNLHVFSLRSNGSSTCIDGLRFPVYRFNILRRGRCRPRQSAIQPRADSFVRTLVNLDDTKLQISLLLKRNEDYLQLSQDMSKPDKSFARQKSTGAQDTASPCQCGTSIPALRVSLQS